MAHDEDIRQPQTISSALANYLDMTKPRPNSGDQRPRRHDQHKPIKWPPIDNRGLTLEEGNDFA